MNLEIHYFKNDDALALEALENIKDIKYVGLDCETTGLHSMNELERLRLVQLAVKNPKSDGILVYLFDIWYLGPVVLEALVEYLIKKGRVKVGHHLKFDWKFLHDDLGIDDLGAVFDTMLAAQILSMGYIFSGFGLDDVVYEYLGEKVDKTLQTSDWSGELTEEQILYAAKDPALCLVLRDTMMEKLKEHKLLATAKLEFDCMEPVASLERNGLKLNRLSWAKLYRKAFIRHQEVEKQLHEMLGLQRGLFEGAGSELNLNSKNDIVNAYKRLGVELPTYDDGSGDITTESWKLVGIQDKHPSIPLLIEHRGLAKSLSSYGLNWFDDVNKYTGRIHATFNPMGAKTSRFASYNPNLQNLKKDDEYRNCFEAEDGNTLVWADYSQMELREAAEFSRDEVMLEAFNSGLDFHKYTAALCYEKEYDDVTYDERSIIKNMNYLVTYGGSAWKLAQQAGITLERAEEVMAIYWTRFKRLKVWLDNEGRHAAKYHMSWTIIGRKIKFRFDPTDKKALSHAERNGKNTPMQGSCTDILKRALRLLYDAILPYGGRIMIVNIVHDEIVLECDEELRNRAAFLLKKSMLDAGKEFLKIVPVEVSIKAGKLWRK